MAEADMLSGIYGWILRIVSAVMLIGVGIVYVIEKNLKEKKALSDAAEAQMTDLEMTEESVSAQ